MPLRPEQHQDGVSFMPLLRSEPWDRGPIFWHYPHYGNQGGTPCSGMRDGPWKLIAYFETGHCALFNLREDIGETHDLSVASPERVSAMHRQLVAWRQDVKALMPMKNPGGR